MATLTGQSIKDTYKSLLKTESTVGFSGSTPTRIEDGSGGQSAMSLGQSRVNIVGSLSFNLSTTSTPRANLHIVGTSAQSMLIQNSNGYNKFYVGDYLGGHNVKLGDIDSSSPGNNTYLYVEDSSNRVVSKTTYFGVNQTVPTATLHVGSNSGKALFQLGSDKDSFTVSTPTNATMFSIDATNDKVFINGSVVITGKGSFSGPTQRIVLEEYFAQLPRPFLFAKETSPKDGKEYSKIFDLVPVVQETEHITWTTDDVERLKKNVEKQYAKKNTNTANGIGTVTVDTTTTSTGDAEIPF